MNYLRGIRINPMSLLRVVSSLSGVIMDFLRVKRVRSGVVFSLCRKRYLQSQTRFDLLKKEKKVRVVSPLWKKRNRK